MRGELSFDVRSLFEVCAPKERVDGPTFGHHAGMVIRPEVVERMVDEQEARHGKAFKIFFSPRGKKVDQDLLRALAQRIAHEKHVAFFAARYEGMDARIEEEYADEILSVGDFVVMGGDLPLQLTLEGLFRYLPGVVGKSESVERDSFTGPWVDAPAYTAPVAWKGKSVPDVIRSGDHKRIEQWEEEYAIRDTVRNHFTWLRSHPVTPQQRDLVRASMPPHYIALMHDEISLPHGFVGTTSVTTLDIHDIARSSRTYGVKGFFIVTPLVDQQKIVTKLLSFWRSDEGGDYNPHRQRALEGTHLVDRYHDVVNKIEELEGVKPLVVVTSAQSISGVESISYYDQHRVWESQRPVLILLGTGRGLAPEVSARADFALLPLMGYSSFNHLSVRSAAAIILDRWLGINLKKAPIST